MKNMEWIDIWKQEPPRNELILFLVGGDDIHLGELIGAEKLRKCQFFSDISGQSYDCDTTVKFEFRVTHWCEIPEPQKCTT